MKKKEMKLKIVLLLLNKELLYHNYYNIIFIKNIFYKNIKENNKLWNKNE